AYRTYEAVPGVDQDGYQDGARYQGDRIATFPITSHFDIIREYNANTGEQSNVIVENATDRPWWEREYIRVDWAGGAASSTVDFADIFKTIATGADWVRETEIFDPDHIVLDEDHIQFTLNATLSDGGYSCFVNYGSGNCGSGDVRIRYSFAKVDEAEAAAFQPREYFDNDLIHNDDGTVLRSIGLNVGVDGDTQIVDFACTPELIEFFDENLAPGYLTLDDCSPEYTPQFERFGFFRTERYGYDRRLGPGNDLNRAFYANIHPLWQNPWSGEGAERAPTPDRELRARPIIYYVNADYPADLEPITAQIGADWDQAFIETARARTGRTVDALRQQVAEDFPAEDWMFLEGDTLKGGALFQIRRNTCSAPGIAAYLARFPALQGVVDEATGGQAINRGNVQRACSALAATSRARRLEPSFDWQQIGDVRFNFVNWIDEDQPSGPLGYGPSSADPETGRIVSAAANVYGAAIDTYARSAADIVRAMNEDLDLATLVSGGSYQEWLDGARSVADMPLTVDPAVFGQIQQRTGRFDVEAAYGRFRMDDGAIDHAALERNIRRRMERPDPSDPIAKAFDAPVDEGRQRLQALQADPRFRARMLDEQLVGAAKPLLGLPAGAELTQAQADEVLGLVADPGAMARRYEARLQHLARHNIYSADFIDDSVIGQALAMKGMDPEEVFQTLRAQIYRAVMLHEIGHTLGMTHNFKGSFDALNYQD
ncbi:MAG: zinc-dependent metalloprotease, partial [Myxococcales bacterium]|nr:zinc-dependent metalloprotease [Myxococcales bacterium]